MFRAKVCPGSRLGNFDYNPTEDHSQAGIPKRLFPSGYSQTSLNIVKLPPADEVYDEESITDRVKLLSPFSWGRFG
jgi:hypothetical protein